MKRDQEASEPVGRSAAEPTRSHRPKPPRNRSGAMLNLQRSAGNRAVAGMMSATPVQRAPLDPVVVQREISDEALDTYFQSHDAEHVTETLADAVIKSDADTPLANMMRNDVSSVEENEEENEEETKEKGEGGEDATKVGDALTPLEKKKRPSLVKKKLSVDKQIAALQSKSDDDLKKEAKLKYMKEQRLQKEAQFKRELEDKELAATVTPEKLAQLASGKSPFSRYKQGSFLGKKNEGKNMMADWAKLKKKETKT